MKPFVKKIVSLGLVALMAITPLVQAATPAYAISAEALRDNMLAKLNLGPEATASENWVANVALLGGISGWLNSDDPSDPEFDIQNHIKSKISTKFGVASSYQTLKANGFTDTMLIEMFKEVMATQTDAAELARGNITIEQAKTKLEADCKAVYGATAPDFQTSFKKMKKPNSTIKEAVKDALNIALSQNNLINITVTKDASGKLQYDVAINSIFESTLRDNVRAQLSSEVKNAAECTTLTTEIMEIYNIFKDSIIAEIVTYPDIMADVCQFVQNTKIGTVTTIDAYAPTIQLAGAAAMTLKVGDAFTDLKATAVGFDYKLEPVILTNNVIVTGDVDTTKAGVYERLYTVVDAFGKTVSVKRTVTVTSTALVDHTAPVITLLGKATISLTTGTAYVEPGFTASDINALGVAENLTSKVKVTGAVDTTKAGTYVLSYSVSDSAGNAAVVVKRTVIVADATGGTGGGGVVTGGTVTIPTPVTPLSPVKPPTVIIPTPEIPKAPVKLTQADALAKLKALGVVKGKTSLNKPVSASAFANAMAKMLGITKKKGETSLAALKRVGVFEGVIIKGDKITRDQMSLVVYNIYSKFKTSKTVDKSIVFKKEFKTKSQFKTKLRTVLEKLYNTKKVNGKSSVTETDLVEIYFAFFM